MKEVKTKRNSVPAIEGIIGKKFNVLDDGFVYVVDYMGSDSAIVQAARVSYGEGTKHVHEDRGLIRYLMRHDHTTPFEMCDLKLHVRVPMDCWRQWIRHRTASVNEYSTRYSIAIDSAQSTSASNWRQQSDVNKQGSTGWIDDEIGASLSNDEFELQRHAASIYQKRLDVGVAREQARKDLPLSTYTEAYWKIDLHNLLGFLELRMDEHAQVEIRSYARMIGEEILSRWCPITWEAFQDYRTESMKLSGNEIAIAAAATKGDFDTCLKLAVNNGWVDSNDLTPKANREFREARDKFNRLNIATPWAK